MTVFDGPGHMAEEIKHASWSVPRAIVVTFFLGSILAFGLLLSFLYSIQIPLNVVVPGYGITNTVYGTPDSPIGATIFTVSNLFYDVFAARYPDASGLPDLNCSAAAGGVCPPRASRTGQNGAIFFTCACTPVQCSSAACISKLLIHTRSAAQSSSGSRSSAPKSNPWSAPAAFCTVSRATEASHFQSWRG